MHFRYRFNSFLQVLLLMIAVQSFANKFGEDYEGQNEQTSMIAEVFNGLANIVHRALFGDIPIIVDRNGEEIYQHSLEKNDD